MAKYLIIICIIILLILFMLPSWREYPKQLYIRTREYLGFHKIETFLDTEDEYSQNALDRMAEDLAKKINTGEASKKNIKELGNYYERYKIKKDDFIDNPIIKDNVLEVYKQIDNFERALVNFTPTHNPQQLLITEEFHAKIVPKKNNLDLENPVEKFVVDSQNAHNSSLTLTFQDKINSLIATDKRGKIKKEDIKNMTSDIIEQSTLSEQKKKNAKLTMNKMISDNAKMSGKFLNYDELRETDVLSLIINRINDPNNKKNKEGLINAFSEQLSDSTINGSTTCSVGRTRRVLSSLSFLDYDQTHNMVSSQEINEMIGNRFNFEINRLEKIKGEKEREIKKNKIRNKIYKEFEAFMNIVDIKEYFDDSINYLNDYY